MPNEWTHAVEGLVGAAVSCLMFALKLSHERHIDTIKLHERLKAIETKLDLLMDGRELLRVRK